MLGNWQIHFNTEISQNFIHFWTIRAHLLYFNDKMFLTRTSIVSTDCFLLIFEYTVTFKSTDLCSKHVYKLIQVTVVNFASHYVLLANDIWFKKIFFDCWECLTHTHTHIFSLIDIQVHTCIYAWRYYTFSFCCCMELLLDVPGFEGKRIFRDLNHFTETVLKFYSHIHKNIICKMDIQWISSIWGFLSCSRS